MMFQIKINKIRNLHGFSLIELMSVIAILGIVLGLLYAYSDQGWRLFYQSYGRGLSQVKAKLALKVISEDLREANKSRISISRGNTYGIPLPDDAQESTPYIYFTKPKTHDKTGDIIGYDYILYYFAKPKELYDRKDFDLKKRTLNEQQKFLILKYIKFIDQSKIYTEDLEKTWPFPPPIIDIHMSRLPEDESYIGSLNKTTSSSGSTTETNQNTNSEELFYDHFALLKKDSRNISVSGNFTASSLTDPFTSEEVNVYFGQDYKKDKPIRLKFIIHESPFLFGLMGAKSELEVKITPRN